MRCPREVRRAHWATLAFCAALAAGAQPEDSSTGAVECEVTCPGRVAAFSLTPPHVFKGFFPEGARLRIVQEVKPGWVRVRFGTQDGRCIEGLVRASDLPAPAEPGPALAAGETYCERAWLEGAEGYREAVQIQSRTKAPLLLYFYADWNPECRLANRELLDTIEFKNKTKNILKVRINPARSDEEGRLAARFGVSSFPTTLVVDHPHAEPRKIRLVRKVYGRFKADSVAYALAKITAGSQPAPTNPPTSTAGAEASVTGAAGAEK